MSITGLPDQGPVRTGIAVSDSAAGHQLAIGILIALHERARTGLGQWVRVSLLEAMITFLDFQAVRWTIDGRVPSTEGNHHPTARPMGTYRAADGHLNVAAPHDRLWSRLCEVLEAPDLATTSAFATARDRYRNREALERCARQPDSRRAPATSGSTSSTRPASRAARCSPSTRCSPIRRCSTWRWSQRIDHPVRGPVDVLRNPITMSRSQPVTATSSPRPGRDRDEVLAELGLPPLA